MHLFANAHVRYIVASHDGMQFATIQEDRQTLRIWNAMTGAYCSTLPAPDEAFQTFLSLAWSPDNGFVAASTHRGQVFVWNVKTQTLVFVYRGHDGPVNSVSWSPDGTALVSASWDGSIHIWTLSPEASARLLCHSRSNKPFEVTWSPDGTLVASCWRDGGIRLWNARTGQRVFTYRGHTSAVQSCAWSPDGTRIASAGINDTVQVWRVPVGDQWWRTLLGVWGLRLFHLFPRLSCNGPMHLVRWSPDGRAIAALSEDGVCIWDATDGTRLTSLPGRSLRSFSWFHGDTCLIIAHDHPAPCQSWQWQEEAFA